MTTAYDAGVLIGAAAGQRRLWAEHHVRAERSRVRRMRHPRLGEVPLRLVMLREGVDNSPRVVFHLPATDEPS